MGLKVIEAWRVFKLLENIKDHLDDYSYNDLKALLEAGIEYMQKNMFTAYE